ncbi:hypothetical protein AVEN_61444-1 [Araneus ventricosus]|uniref:Uncharacterized protein n=1 Tax=Araneus ventricosus TaxID=182803 RepID=A0A4Y2KCY1_ARAVE|nr:hypothetical protein AVEN_61444-1 [Araneus ventricosus]
MSSSSLSEEVALEYNMFKDLEDTPAVINPPPSSILEESGTIFIKWLSSTTQYIKRYKTQDREQQQKTSTQKKRERHDKKNPDGSSSSTYHKRRRQ